MKYKTSQKFYDLLSYDYVSINYMFKKLDMTYQHVWNCIALMKAKKMLKEKVSPIKNTIMVYKLMAMTFNEFLEKIN